MNGFEDMDELTSCCHIDYRSSFLGMLHGPVLDDGIVDMKRNSSAIASFISMIPYNALVRRDYVATFLAPSLVNDVGNLWQSF